ncbi:sugar transferase [Nocardioides zeae]|uniref:Sugar transferase n=1 Tax=Nocardioides imazamoxiresistens TaxID=3231893 RepID=A0ABU3PXK2_9ACTN|nr:sugar transferase [Nocardioides zeae]MDT9593547.1 sugar transferase [Nocardioides zeae]
MTVVLGADQDQHRATLSAGMRHRALVYLPLSALLVDVMLIGVTAVLAVAGRNSLALFDRGADVTDTLGVVGPALFVVWIVTIGAVGGYSRSVFGAGPDEYKRVFNASLFTAGIIGIGCYLAKFQLSRGFFLLAIGIGIPLLLLGRFGLRRLLHQAYRAGLLRHRVIIAGRPSHVDEIAAVLKRETSLGYQVVGAVTPAGHVSGTTASGIEVLGDSDELAASVKRAEADIVFFASGAFRTSDEMRRAAWDLEQHKTQVVVAPSVTDVARERVTVRPVGGLPLMHLDTARSAKASRWAKRTFDLLGASTLIVLFSPLLLLAALRVKAFDRGPVLFRQTRTGRDGHEFACFKFRTMVVDAEARLAALHAEAGFDGGLFKMRDDPRITKPGRWLRRFSIDELPQLFNVVRGEMSLVGPRPPLPSEVATYDDAMRRRLRVLPGMTGLWQISGRSDLSWEEAIRLDIYYVDNWSMVQDLSILARTLGAVVSSRGAY